MPKKKLDKLEKIPPIQKDSIKVNIVSEKLKVIQSENHGGKDDKIKISFEVFAREVKLFNLGSATSEWYISLFDTLNHLTSITKKQLFSEYYSKYEPHHYEGKINLKDEYLLNEQISDEAYQLRISKSKGRIHGFFVGNTYYIRFLDNEHNMYDSEGYGTVVACSYPMNPYDILSIENKQLKASLLEEKEKNECNSSLICNYCSECNVVDKKDNIKIVDKFRL